MQVDNESELDTWLADQLVRSEFRQRRIDFSSSDSWRLDQEGILRHISGRFFSVVGLKWRLVDQVFAQPFIDQPEVGQLGFLVRTREPTCELLLQAKIEPGNQGAIQLAPSCQATQSNSDRVHGGAPTPFVDWFVGDAAPQPLFASLQSEQGSRFLNKFNRNLLCCCQDEIQLPDSHRWVDFSMVQNMLFRDYRINTDARSVLACSPWQEFVSRPLFSRFDTEFSRELAESYATVSAARLEQARAMTAELRRASLQVQRCALSDLPGWVLGADGVFPVEGEAGAVQIGQFQVHVLGREVSDWDQPLMLQPVAVEAVLAMARRDGCLLFCLAPQQEPGLLNQAELGSSWQGRSAVLSRSATGTWFAQPGRAGLVLARAQR